MPILKNSAGRTIKGAETAVLAAAVILISANLRAPLTSVSPLLAAISSRLGLTHAVAGTLTTLPLLAFASFSVLSPRLAGRYGLETVLKAALLALAAGLLLRPWFGVGLLLAGTALAGMGIAACNVLLPAFIKRYFPRRIGLMTGLFSVSMNLTGSIAAAVSIPLSRSGGWGWEKTLAVWGVFAFAAASYLLLYVRAGGQKKAEAAGGNGAMGRKAIWRYKLSWQMTLYMGIQSFLFFVVMAWLPDIAAERGIAADASGWMVSLMQFAGLPFNFAAPLLAARVKDQRAFAVASAAIAACGIGCLMFGHAALIAVGGALIGISGGLSFSLSMMFFNMRTTSSRQASAISGMAQSLGYSLACTGPALFGWLHDRSGGWRMPLLLLSVIIVVFVWAALGAGKNQQLPKFDNEGEAV